MVEKAMGTDQHKQPTNSALQLVTVLTVARESLRRFQMLWHRWLQARVLDTRVLDIRVLDIRVLDIRARSTMVVTINSDIKMHTVLCNLMVVITATLLRPPLPPR